MKVLDIIKQASAYLGLLNDFTMYFLPYAESLENNNSGTEGLEGVLPNQISLSLEDNSQEIIPEEKLAELNLLILALNNTQEKLLKSLPIITKQIVSIDTYKISLSSLEKRLNRIISVRQDNKKLKFKKLEDYIFLQSPVDFDKSIEIEYSYFLPNIENINSQTALDNICAKQSTIALGVASEYNFILGLFDDASVFNTKFMQELLEDSKSELSNFNTPKRNWR